MISAASAHSPKMAMNRCLTWSGMLSRFLVSSASAPPTVRTTVRLTPHAERSRMVHIVRPDCFRPGYRLAISDAGLRAQQSRRALGRIRCAGYALLAWISDRSGPRPLASRAMPPCCRRSGPRAPTIHRASTRRLTSAKHTGVTTIGRIIIAASTTAPSAPTIQKARRRSRRRARRSRFASSARYQSRSAKLMEAA